MSKAKSRKPKNRVSVYFVDSDAALIAKAAERDGIPPTTWVRDVAVAVARSGKSPVRTETVQLSETV